MEKIGIEIRRVPLRLRLLDIARQHAAEYDLCAPLVVDDIRSVASRLAADDLTTAFDQPLISARQR